MLQHFGPNGDDWPFPRLRSIGRRGAYLVAKGTLYMLYGCGLAWASMGGGYYAVLETLAPLTVWGAIWIFIGLLAIFCAFVPQWRTLDLEPVAFAALMAMATVWALGIAAVYWLPVHVDYPWIVAALFASLMASTSIVAGWPEP